MYLTRLLIQTSLLLTLTAGLQITTTAKSKLQQAELQNFLATPCNWPKIVASSNRVVSKDPTVPLRRGSSVEEYFGLNLLFVKWQCVESKPGTIVVRSPDGITGIANDCSMRFDIDDEEVNLTMGYNPLSPLAILAFPVLAVDNWVALNILLPAAVDRTPLDSFRRLMGVLYGGAGIAHLLDLLIGPSALLVAAGAPIFANLDVLGQQFALLWCAAGPLAFLTSRSKNNPRLADLGLTSYGLIEVLGAYLIGNSDALVNAIGVQGIVLAAWIYSQKKQTSDDIATFL
jgi:hypothetical protein